MSQLPRDALGAGLIYMRSDDKRTSRTLSEATYTRLLARGNTKESQANVWLLGGIGSVEGNNFSGSKLSLVYGLYPFP